jgi:hypothetical protein
MPPPTPSSRTKAGLDVPILVPPEISQAKLDRELAQWHANSEAYRRRGWLLLSAVGLQVEVAFLANVPIGVNALSVVTVATRFNYDNYDLWPPSLTFVDPRTGEAATPVVGAIEVLGTEARNALLVHPMTGQPFLCVPGVREYHSHPQHTGDDWLLHRGHGAGRLAVVCDTIWRRMVRNVLGLQVSVQFLPGARSQVNAVLAQGDIDALSATIGPQ